MLRLCLVQLRFFRVCHGKGEGEGEGEGEGHGKNEGEGEGEGECEGWCGGRMTGWYGTWYVVLRAAASAPRCNDDVTTTFTLCETRVDVLRVTMY